MHPAAWREVGEIAYALRQLVLAVDDDDACRAVCYVLQVLENKISEKVGFSGTRWGKDEGMLKPDVFRRNEIYVEIKHLIERSAVEDKACNGEPVSLVEH